MVNFVVPFHGEAKPCREEREAFATKSKTNVFAFSSLKKLIQNRISNMGRLAETCLAGGKHFVRKFTSSIFTSSLN